MNVGRTPWSGLAKVLQRKPTRASAAVLGDRPTLDLVKKFWKQGDSVSGMLASTRMLTHGGSDCILNRLA